MKSGGERGAYQRRRRKRGKKEGSLEVNGERRVASNKRRKEGRKGNSKE